MRHAVVFFVLIAIVTIGVGELEINGANSAHAQDAAAQPASSPPPRANSGSVLNVPTEKMRDALSDICRLTPDRRFLSAVAKIHAFLSGQETAEVSADFSAGQWQIGYRGKAVGTLPEFPDFPDFMNLLESWVQSVQARYPVQWGAALEDTEYQEIRELLDGFLSSRVLTALRKIDGLWKDRGPQPAMLAAATRGLTLLLVQSLDSLETGDQLPAKAVAVLALDKALTDTKCPREECLLSYTMDYSSHAVKLAKTLPEHDPVRSYVLHDDGRLMEIAIQENAPVESRYFRLLRMVENSEEVDSIKNWMRVYFTDASFSLPVMKIWMDLHRFATIPHLSEALPRLVMMDVFRDEGAIALTEKDFKKSPDGKYTEEDMLSAVQWLDAVLNLVTPTLFSRFETGLQKVSSKCTGPFLDSKSYQAFYNGYFFSSFYAAGLHYLDALSSIEAAKEFASTLPEASSGTAADLRHWYLDLTAAKDGKAAPGVLQADLEGLPLLGMQPLMRTFTEQEIYLPYGDPGRQKAVKSMVPRMDTRATNLDRLFSMARSHLLDLKLAERLAEREVAIDLQKFPLIQAWLADIKGDEQLLKDLLHTDGLYFWTKIKILDFLEQQQNVAPEVLGEEYRKLLVDYPGQWEIANGYAKYLERIGKNEDSRSVLNGWLALNVETLGLERIFITTAVARTYYNEGRYEEGFEVITPEIASWQAGAMQMGAKLLEKLNRKTESEKLARAIVDRYPDGPEYRAFLAGLYWSHGKPKEAADLLKAGGKRLNNNVWHFTIAPEFAEAFSEKTKEDALTAYSALIAQGFEPMDILSLVYPLEKKGKYDLAFELSSQIHANGIGNLFFLTHSYHCLKECKGKPDALDWLRKRVPPEMLNPLAMLAYTSGEYDPLWDIIGDPGKGRNADFVWVMRAAASERLGSDKDPHRNALMAHYEKKDGGIMDTANNMISGVTSRFSGGSKENDDGYYDQISRFLCGLTREEEILKLATDPNKRCEIAYYIAVRAQGEGRYSDASDWYRVALETGLTKMGEHRWANETLYMWLGKQKSLSRLQQERL